MSYVNFDNIDACKFDQIATHLVQCAKIHDLLVKMESVFTHGKRGQDFCIVFYSNLHITAHFFGKRNQNMKRDFTWVQSLRILFDTYTLFIGSKDTLIWDDSNDHISLGFNGEPINLMVKALSGSP